MPVTKTAPRIPKPAPTSDAWAPPRCRISVPSRPPTPNIETNPSSSGTSETPAKSTPILRASRRPPRTSSTRIVQQQQAAADEDAEQEDRVREVDLDHAIVASSICSAGRAKDTLGDMGCAAPDVVPWG